MFKIGSTFEEIVRSNTENSHIVGVKEDPEAWIQKRLALHRSKQGVLEYQLDDGRWVQVNQYRTSDDGTLVMRTDITQQKHLEAQLLQAQKMETVGTLAGGIAHDLNNILTPIFGSLEFALRKCPPTTKSTRI